MTEDELKDILYENATKRRTIDQLTEIVNREMEGDLFKKIAKNLWKKSPSKEEYLLMEFSKDIFTIIDSELALSEFSLERLINEKKIDDKGQLLQFKLLMDVQKGFAEHLKKKIREYYFIE